jgi:Family of unknown function (DUF5994)
MMSANGPSTPQFADARPAGGSHRGSTRLVLRDAGTAPGTWDGAWWPHTRLLLAELPGLITALTGRYGPITRASYSLSFWADTPHRLVLDGRRVRLRGSRTVNPYSLSLTGGFGVAGVDLLVVAPEADAALAARGLEIAVGGSGSLDWSAGSAAAEPVAAAARPSRLAAATLPERAWENEGGSTAP